MRLVILDQFPACGVGGDDFGNFRQVATRGAMRLHPRHAFRRQVRFRAFRAMTPVAANPVFNLCTSMADVRTIGDNSWNLSENREVTLPGEELQWPSSN